MFPAANVFLDNYHIQVTHELRIKIFMNMVKIQLILKINIFLLWYEENLP